MQHHQIHVLFYFFSFSLVILDFPIPGKETIPSTTDTISIFHRPIESSIPKEEEEKKESEESEEEEESDNEDNEDTIIQFSKDAPNAPILGPFCSICGKYGQYICDLTDEDVCSIECKKKSETLYHTQHPSIEPEVSFQPEVSIDYKMIDNRRKI